MITFSNDNYDLFVTNNIGLQLIAISMKNIIRTHCSIKYCFIEGVKFISLSYKVLDAEGKMFQMT